MDILERRVAKTITWTFKILFKWGFMVAAFFGGAAAMLSDATQPSGWYTSRQYADAQGVHSVFWLFIFVCIFACVLVFLKFAIGIFCFVAFIAILLWVLKTLCLAVRAARIYGIGSIKQIFLARLCYLFDAFDNFGVIRFRNHIQRFLCALILGYLFLGVVYYNPVATVAFNVLYLRGEWILTMLYYMGWVCFYSGAFALFLL